jgi:hypothetical protein
VRAFNTLTRLGITPRCCSTDSLGEAIPATVYPRAVRPVSAPRHCAAYHCMANAPSPQRGGGGTLECSFRDYTGLRHDVGPAGAAIPVVVSPMRSSPSLQRHAVYCNGTPDAVGAHGGRTSPYLPLYLVRAPVDDTVEPVRGRRPDSQPLHYHPRSCSCSGTGRATTPRLEQDSPGRSSTTWHCSPCT